MIESTSRKYEMLPEVKKKREEENKRQQWREDLKTRRSKVNSFTGRPVHRIGASNYKS